MLLAEGCGSARWNISRKGIFAPFRWYEFGWMRVACRRVMRRHGDDLAETVDGSNAPEMGV